ncbi:protein FAR-RED IMPAIRED RESPONSE 1-like [Aegilops tauschii subsp. strangulata]|uniref:protein FAR-RED IMPAIRED RESPONSE 1-like n=1 Tax=Aegilops tauschii subsp. strangulata TaxID=200361 RepID=UPI00098A5F31|nr:protein FAR-RED IMPAIRED RESPONSE 1-like [Aegilops tauschii subsp. strangulata]
MSDAARKSCRITILCSKTKSRIVMLKMLVDQFGRLKELNREFFFDYEVDEAGTLLHLFWAAATSRKNYSHFHDVLSFDSTYNTNQYDYIFAPFTAINHHMQSVFLGAGFLLNETAKDYIWLFDVFLKCMGGVAPGVIITNECGSMRKAIAALLPNTKHRLCMWHIMRKVPEKVSPELRSDELFYKRLDSCVWNSETPEEFEECWKSLILDFGLHNNEWFVKCYLIRGSRVPAYFMDIPLAGILRTTSRSESENSFFKNFIRRKLSFIEFWLRFDTTIKSQRQEELSEVFAAREHCDVQETTTVGNLKIVSISDQSHPKNRVREVHLETTTMIDKCSCKLFESKGIVSRHIIRVLRGAKINELPTFYVLKRWERMCKRDVVYNDEGNPLEDNPIDCIDMDTRRKISDARNKLEDIIRCAKKSSRGLDLLNTGAMILGGTGEQRCTAAVILKTIRDSIENGVKQGHQELNPKN